MNSCVNIAQLVTASAQCAVAPGSNPSGVTFWAREFRAFRFFGGNKAVRAYKFKVKSCVIIAQLVTAPVRCAAAPGSNPNEVTFWAREFRAFGFFGAIRRYTTTNLR